MIRVLGQPLPPPDPKLKLPPIPSFEGRPTAKPVAAAHEMRSAEAGETKLSETKLSETKPQSETKPGSGGRPRTRDADPWIVAGISRAAWYRKQKTSGAKK